MYRLYQQIGLVFVLLSLAGCIGGCKTTSKAESPAKNPPKNKESKNSKTEKTRLEKAKDQKKTGDEYHFGPFGLKLYQQLYNQDKNIVFSPFSIANALGLAAAGTDGKTFRQIMDVIDPHRNLASYKLELNSDFEWFHTGLTGISKKLEKKVSDKKGLTFQNANRLWLDRSLQVQSSYLDFVDKYYGAAFKKSDFSKNPKKAADSINRWVSDRTNGKIPKLIDKISPKTKSVLANAVYFLGNWQYPFNKKFTQDKTFHTLSGEKVETPFMSIEKRFAYTQADSVKVVTLPYEGGDFAMSLIVPGKGQFETFRKKLSFEQIERWLESQRKTTKVELQLPRFEVEYSAELVEALKGLGIEKLFGDTDFSRMLESGQVGVNRVVHRSFIEVDEKGTEAAAATGVTTVTSLPMRAKKVELTLDRPFLFVLHERQTGALLFMGQVVTL